jgi:broad specificity phosphatase PhoE
VSHVYLIRHGQAGTRTNYDTLSDLGRQQARRLGRTLVDRREYFTTIIAGALERQRATAAEVAAAYREAGAPCPEPVVEPLWNEFDLDAVYRDIAPRLAEVDPKFRADYEAMQAHLADASHAIHRQWSSCDLPVLLAWVNARFPVETETWVEFQRRIANALGGLERFGPEDRVAVFTSATPTAIAIGLILNADLRTRLHLTGALYNSAYSTLRRRNGEWSLASFNNIPHLADPESQTFR